MSDKVREKRQFKLQKAKCIVGSDSLTTLEEFMLNMCKDTYASIASHQGLLLYTALASDEPTEVLKVHLITKMVQPLPK